MNTLNIISEVRKWQKNIAQKSKLHLKQIQFRDSLEWKYDGATISHKTGKFFIIIGVHWTQDGKILYQPLIKQTEVGTLGFLMRQNKKNTELLIQAKTEPGNTGTTQLAPTCQATASNIAQVHHGDKPYFANWFTNKNGGFIHSSFQSEHGTRFYHKRNLNVLKLIYHDPQLDLFHRWYSTEDILSLVHEDFLLNTDTRSVLVCSPWRILLNREPFTRYHDTFSRELCVSYDTKTEREVVNIKKVLSAARLKHIAPTVYPLNKLKGWNISKGKIFRRIDNGGYRIIQMKVNVAGREVSHWDQPFIKTIKRGVISLICGRFNGVLHFLFCLTQEPGLYYKIELTPGKIENKIKQKVIARYIQSEEGGRFMNEICKYCLVDIGTVEKKHTSNHWLTLGQIESLLKENGIFTNEARSAISLLLYWL